MYLKKKQECKIRKVITDNEYMFYSFSIKVIDALEIVTI